MWVGEGERRGQAVEAGRRRRRDEDEVEQQGDWRTGGERWQGRMTRVSTLADAVRPLIRTRSDL